jgi:hypothetical protein
LSAHLQDYARPHWEVAERATAAHVAKAELDHVAPLSATTHALPRAAAVATGAVSSRASLRARAAPEAAAPEAKVAAGAEVEAAARWQAQRAALQRTYEQRSLPAEEWGGSQKSLLKAASRVR